MQYVCSRTTPQWSGVVRGLLKYGCVETWIKPSYVEPKEMFAIGPIDIHRPTSNNEILDMHEEMRDT